ncbi:MAG: GTP-binding protein, partial [Candidatus Lokiarchaeota archaeon]|nr:GTP-binding protein [Candidatus Lokiarchaeota archaeon]
MSDEYDYLFKCICVGDGGAGKTALVIRFSQGYFAENYKMTIGVEFAVKTIDIDEIGKSVKLQIWDTGGQERFQYVRPLYYRGSMGAIVLFDLTNRESFEHIAKWIEEVQANAGEIPMLLVGNKKDLVDERQVDREEAEEFAKEFEMYYIESSAKDGTGVGDVFAILSCLMIGIEVPDSFLEPGVEPAVSTVSSKELEPVTEEQIPVPQPEPKAPEPVEISEIDSLPTAFMEGEVEEEEPPPFEETSEEATWPSDEDLFDIPEVPGKTEPQPSTQPQEQPEPQLQPQPEPEPEEWAIPEVPTPSKIEQQPEAASVQSQPIPSDDEIDASIPAVPSRPKPKPAASASQGPITFDDDDEDLYAQPVPQKPEKSTSAPPLIFTEPDDIPDEELQF